MQVVLPSHVKMRVYADRSISPPVGMPLSTDYIVGDVGMSTRGLLYRRRIYLSAGLLHAEFSAER